MISLLFVLSLVCAEAKRHRAPFVWGSATAAYQVEGYRNESGREPSVWDCFDTDMTGSAGVECKISAFKPNGVHNIFEQQNAADADKDYVSFPQTVDLLTAHGFQGYRMSVSWSRVLSYHTNSKGQLVPRENPAGIQHYHTVLQALVTRGIEVALTMWHWDTPQALENYAYANPACIHGKATTGSAWLCEDIADQFEIYAKLLVREYGPYVQYWITLNEPLTIVQVAYAAPAHAPGRCGDRTVCHDGDELVEPFVAAHNLLRSHAKAFNAWRTSSNRRPESLCGITLNGDWSLPYSDSPEDKAAVVRDLEYQMAIFFDPIYYGRWPESVVRDVGSALPKLDADLIHNTHVRVYFQNHYTTHYARYDANAGGYLRATKVSTTGYKNGIPVGLPSSNGWLFMYPQGLALNQNWLHERYPSMSFMVTENGWGNRSVTRNEDINDLVRCNFYRSYIGNMSYNANVNGIHVMGFFAWSIMDNYEWADGFSTRFGLTYVDYATQERTPKLSLRWFANVTRDFKEPPTRGQEAFPRCEAFL